jgi:nucleotide-binding universal stress UspA family protein
MILQIAEDAKVSLISMWAREGTEGHPHIGPASVGHTARFVLDHAPCDVLLLRE